MNAKFSDVAVVLECLDAEFCSKQMADGDSSASGHVLFPKIDCPIPIMPM